MAFGGSHVWYMSAPGHSTAVGELESSGAALCVDGKLPVGVQDRRKTERSTAVKMEEQRWAKAREGKLRRNRWLDSRVGGVAKQRKGKRATATRKEARGRSARVQEAARRWSQGDFMVKIRGGGQYEAWSDEEMGCASMGADRSCIGAVGGATVACANSVDGVMPGAPMCQLRDDMQAM